VLNFVAVEIGTSIPVTLESVYVENLSQGGDTTLYGNEPYLFLSWPSAIDEFHLFSIQGIMVKQNYPNPYFGNTEINLMLNETI